MDTTGYAAMNKHIGADEPLELAFTGYTRYFLCESIDKWREHPSLSDELADPNNIIIVRMNHVTHERQIVVEREHNILTLKEALEHETECVEAMFGEVKKWNDFGTFAGISFRIVQHSRQPMGVEMEDDQWEEAGPCETHCTWFPGHAKGRSVDLRFDGITMGTTNSC